MSRLDKEFTEAQELKTTTYGGRHVDVRNDPVDNLAAAMVADGRANEFIRGQCAALAQRLNGKRIILSNARIKYRADQADVNRMDYRNGIVRPYTKMTFGFRTDDFRKALTRHIDSVFRLRERE